MRLFLIAMPLLSLIATLSIGSQHLLEKATVETMPTVPYSVALRVAQLRLHAVLPEKISPETAPHAGVGQVFHR